MKPIGWLNLEFSGSAEGESGGIPGGKGIHNLGGWGQALFAALTIASLIGAAGLKVLMTGLKAAGLFLLRLFTKQFWQQQVLGGLRGLAVRLGRFFWDPRRFRTISREYWTRVGPANGRSLHHWLIPQRWNWVPQGIRNAGFNLLELPRFFRFGAGGGLNQWIGFAQRWGGMRAAAAHGIENFIRVLIPLDLVGAGYLGYRWGTGPSSAPAEPRSGSGSGQGPAASGAP
jgi:hypothetical protein